jgi:cytochrome c-type biogenesis protein CcmH
MRNLAFMLILISSVTFANANELYPFDNKRQQSQFTHLLKELRCLVCQNQDLADSHAPLAIDLKNQVYKMVQDGQSDSQILDYLTNRYGDFILFKPPVKTVTYLLWFGPLLFLCLGLGIFINYFRRHE